MKNINVYMYVYETFFFINCIKKIVLVFYICNPLRFLKMYMKIKNIIHLESKKNKIKLTII